MFVTGIYCIALRLFPEVLIHFFLSFLSFQAKKFNLFLKGISNRNLCFMYWPFHLPHFAELPIITYPTSANVTYSEREAVIIGCKTTGQPVPDVSWIHNGRVKFSGSKTATLNFSSISKTDAGSYTCKANNSAGITEKQLILLVNCKYHTENSFAYFIISLR